MSSRKRFSKFKTQPPAAAPPTVEPTVEPVVEPVVEPTVEPVVEPVVEQAPGKRGSEVALTGPLSMFDFDHLDRDWITNQYLVNSQYTSTDLLHQYNSINSEYSRLRATGSPGRERDTAEALKKVHELASVLRVIGHKV